MDNYSNDFVNQITLNCLISKSQLMKINETKIKKNINSGRNKKIKKYHSQLIKLFENLLNKTEPSNVFDDVKTSYVHFIDKAIIYLENDDEKNDDEKNNDEKNNDEKNDDNKKILISKTEDKLFNNKINNMINECYDKRYHEIILDEEKNEEQEIFDENDENNENDEDDEY
jgi:hypothetical protein